jgi:hypothetical protein
MWRASIRTVSGGGRGKTKHLGSFLNEVDAALAYDRAAREHHQDKAQLNFPESPALQPQAASNQALPVRALGEHVRARASRVAIRVSSHEAPGCDL